TQTVSVFEWSTGDYKRVFNFFSSVVTEGAVIIYESTTRYLYTRAAAESLYKYDITTLPANLTVLSETSTIQLGVDRNFTYRNGTWTCSDSAEPLGVYKTRNRFIRYDESFDRIGDFDLGVMDSGIIESVDFSETIPNIQGFAEGNGYFAVSQGALYETGTPSRYQYQGVKLFNQNGSELNTSLMLPDTMKTLITSEGLQPDQIENTGIQVMNDGTIYSLTVTASDSTSSSITTDEGLIIFEEFSKDIRAVDFSISAATYSATDIRLVQSGLFPLSRDKSGNNLLFNPIDGTEFTTYDQIMDYMISVNLSVFRFYGSSASSFLTDINSDSVLNNYVYSIWNKNNSTFLI
ncbi:MAG: hypothetical protein GY760_27185, partial [Deltaproteobacteria bacterium]|nr:hypothetical protein [Deltaproteobacteria bacterium]